MKNLKSYILGVAILTTLGTNNWLAAEPVAGWVDFGKLPPPSADGQFVEVNIRSNLINMAAKLAAKAEPTVTDALRGLQQVRVNVIGLDDQNRPAMEHKISALQAELTTRGWERIVKVKQAKEDVCVFVKTRGEEAVEGLVVMVMSGGKEAVLVNIVGDIRPDKLALVAERFHIEPLKMASEAMNK